MAEKQYEVLWKKILETLETTVSQITFRTYISTLSPVDLDGTKIVLKTDNELYASSVSKLSDKIKEAIRKADTGITDFELVVEGSDDIYYTSEEEDSEEYAAPAIDPRYTFDSFVAGKSNEFVFAAAQRVAKNPGADFNPLYIYGASGLGKTHLLQAIANYINLHKPGLRVLYTTCDKFINELIDSIYLGRKNNRDRQARFRSHYRGVDVLLIDDVQFLANKQAVQEELFHTFNALQAGKQADRPHLRRTPAGDLHSRREAAHPLRRRADRGHPAAGHRNQDRYSQAQGIRAQGHSSRRRARISGARLGYDVRTLEGRLTKVIFASKLQEVPITLDFAAQALNLAVSEEHETVTSDKIIGSVCSFFKITRENLLGKSKKKELVQPRQICAYLMCEIMSIPLESIGKALGEGITPPSFTRATRSPTSSASTTRIAKEVEDVRNLILKQ